MVSPLVVENATPGRKPALSAAAPTSPAARSPAPAPQPSAGQPATWLKHAGLLDPPDVRFNLVASVGWLVLGGFLAIIAPWMVMGLGPLEQAIGILSLAATAVILGWNAWSSLRIIACTGQARWALPLTAIQLALFTLFFIQLRSHLGAHHFELSRPPGLLDWVAFSLGQAFRAADLVDSLQAYGVDLHMIRPASLTAGWSVATFRALIDIFFLKVIFDSVDRIKSWLSDLLHVEEVFDRFALLLFGAFVVVWLASALYFRPWRRIDLLLWPLENVLRVVDFPDALEILHIRISGVPKVAWEGTLTFVFRLFVAYLVVESLEKAWFWISMRSLRGIGLRTEELQRILRRYAYAEIRQIATERLAQIRDARDATLARLRQAWMADHLNLATAATATLGLVILVIASLRNPAEALVKRVGGSDEVAERRALEALARLGISADSQAAELMSRQASLPAARRKSVVNALGRMGPAALEPLRTLIRDPDVDVASYAVVSLAAHGPAAAPILADEAIVLPDPVGAAAKQVLFSMGPDAVQPLLDTLTAENAAKRFPLLGQLDVYWDLRSSTNVVFGQVAANHRAIRILDDPHSTPDQVTAAVAQLGEQAAVAAPLLWPHLLRSDSTHRMLIEDAFTKSKERVAPFLAERLAVASTEEEKRVAANLLQRIGLPVAAYVVPVLGGPDALAVQLANETLKVIGEEAAPALADGLLSPSADVRSRSSALLIPLGPAGAVQVCRILKDHADCDPARDVLLKIGQPGTSAVAALLADPHPAVRQRARALLQELSPESLELARRQYAASILQKSAELLDKKGDGPAARSLLSQIPLGMRNWPWRHLALRATGQPERRISLADQEYVYSIKFSTDGNELLVAVPSKILSWDLASGRQGAKPYSLFGNVNFSRRDDWPNGHDSRTIERASQLMREMVDRAMQVPGGTDIIACTRKGTFVINQLGDVTAQSAEFATNFGAARSGEPIVFGGNQSISLRRRDLSVIGELKVTKVPNLGWQELRLSDNGRWLLANGRGMKSVFVYAIDCHTGRTVVEAYVPGDYFPPAAIAGNGDILALCKNGKEVEVWDCLVGALLFSWKVQGRVFDLRFSPGGERLAVWTQTGVNLSPDFGASENLPAELLPLVIASEPGGFPDVLAEHPQ